VRVAVVGAGISGLSCATALAAAGVSVTVFDKGRGPAGRTATRRAVVPFDHGAQYFTARDPTFQAEVARLMARGVVAEWTPRVVAVDRVGSVPRPATEVQRLVGVPGMNAIAQALALSLDVRVNVTVTAIDRQSRVGLARVRLEPGARGEVAIQIGPVIRGTALRDATSFIRFNDFANQFEFAAVSNALHERVLREVIGGLDLDAVKGKSINVLGATSLQAGAPGDVALDVVPIQIQAAGGAR